MNIVENVKLAQRTVVVPEHIEYPEIRLTIPVGVVVAGDTIAVIATVYDSKGTVKHETGEKAFMKEFPQERDIGVAALIRMRLTEQPIVVEEKIAGEAIVE